MTTITLIVVTISIIITIISTIVFAIIPIRIGNVPFYSQNGVTNVAPALTKSRATRPSKTPLCPLAVE